MKIKFISYGHKYYEAEGLAPPAHDFLFNLRDVQNPYWNTDLRDYCGLDQPIIDFFKADANVEKRLKDTQELVKDYIIDFINNESHDLEDELVFAFRCTGGRHRSVYFAESIYQQMMHQFAQLLINSEKEQFKDFSRLCELDFQVEHLESHRYLNVAK